MRLWRVSALDHAECQDAKYDRTFSFSANPHPWLTLENDEINFYIYQGCDSYSDGCERQYLIPLKRGTPPDWKNLLDGHPITWFIQGVNVPLRRPLSAYVPGTHYRLVTVWPSP